MPAAKLRIDPHRDLELAAEHRAVRRAEAELRRDYDTLDGLGERNFISTIAAILAEAVFRQGRDAEAETLAAFSAEVAAPDDVETQFRWRQVRAKVCARRGDADEALRLAEEAVALTLQTDDLSGQANAQRDLAEVLAAAGRAAEAETARVLATDLYELKGDIVSAAATRGE